MESRPNIRFLQSDIFENIKDYDLIFISFETLNYDTNLISKIERHYQAKFYLPKEFFPKQGEVLLHKFHSVNYPDPVLYIASYDIVFLDNYLPVLLKNIFTELKKTFHKIGFQLPDLPGRLNLKEEILKSFSKFDLEVNLSFHCKLFYEEKTQEIIPNIFFSYDLKDDYDKGFSNQVAAVFSNYRINRVESSRFNKEELENKIKSSICVISFLTNSHSKGVWFRRDIDTALKMGKPVFVIRKEEDRFEVPPEYIQKVDLLIFGKDDINERIVQRLKQAEKKDMIETEDIKYISVAAFNSDSVKENKTDKLDITNDVRALARLMAYKDLTPPLSVALFGNWGSGKSFFMERLEEEIKKIVHDAKEQNAGELNSIGQKTRIPVCNEIAHIKFNAWHYMDANLWASMVFHIFEELNEACGNLPEDIRKEIDLYNNLASCGEIKKEAENNKNEAERNFKLIQEKLEKLIEDKAEKEKNFKLKFSDAFDITSDVVAANTTVNKLLNDLGISNMASLTYGISKQIADNLASTLKKLIVAIKQTISKPKNILPVLLIFLFSGVLCLAIFLCLKNVDKIWLKSVISYGSSVVVFIYGWYKKVIAPNLKKINSAVQVLNNVNSEVERQKEESLLGLKAEIKKSEIILQSSLTVLQEKQTALVEAEQKLKNIQSEIDSYKHSKLLAGFIQQRLESDDYERHLGIISMIRKDLESLSDILTSEKNKDKPKPFERIILYIDDLDRCPEDRVVQVLEAIHLLLAFPLFVVVVGVDPRWVSNALKKKYPDSLIEGLPDKKKSANNSLNSATTLDYLEKIFQLPILLKQVSPEDSMKLIESIFEKDRKKEELRAAEQKQQQGVLEAQEHGGLEDGNNVDREKQYIPMQDGTSSFDNIEPALSQTIKEKSKETYLWETYKKLEITGDEVNFIQSVSTLIGTTPRAIKRFINTYRLIRSHEYFAVAENNIESLKAIILFLAMANNSRSKLRKMLIVWDRHPQILIEKNFDLTQKINSEFLKSLKLYENWYYIQKVLRYSFYFEE